MMLLGVFLFAAVFWLWCMCITKEGRAILALYLLLLVLFVIGYLIHGGLK